MASLRKQGKSSSGLRMLWIPGRKHHSKSRHETTNKQITYIGNQKKSQVWSMGGSRAQRDIIEADADTSLLDGPSVSGHVPLITVTAAAKCAPDSETPPQDYHSTASTAQLSSKESSPEFTTTADVMPARTQPPILVTTKATAEIVDVSKENRFELLGKDLPDAEDDDHVETTSTSQKSDKEALDSSIETTASTATTPTTPSTTPKSTTDHNSHSKRKHKNHNNNNQSDVNSIESLPDNPKIPDKNLDWVDELIQDDKSNHTAQHRKHKKQQKKKKHTTKTKNLDQLDGLGGKSLNGSDANSTDEEDDAEEKLVKCLYYTLMCCECSIS